MKAKDIKSMARRNPFRPFAVRLNNGAQYTFTHPESIGAPADYHMIFFLGKSEAVRIDTDSIIEITLDPAIEPRRHKATKMG